VVLALAFSSIGHPSAEPTIMANFKVVGAETPQRARSLPQGLSSADARDNGGKLEHFIPLRKAELIERLCREAGLSSADQLGFRRLCELLDATLHYEYHAHFEELQKAYAPFDCDSDTQSLTVPSAAERRAQLDLLFQRFDWLMERANFQRLSRSDLENALASVGHHGLRLEVDLDGFDRLEMYCRGELKRTQLRRSWRTFYRLEQIELPVYQRLVIIFRLRDGRRITRSLDTQDVFIKLFKDVPKADLEMLLPGTRIKMSLKDRIKIIMPTVSGLAVSIYKAFKGALLAAAAGMYGILAVVGVTCGYGVRSFYGYLQTKQRYQLNLTESLYYQNLDNNAGVIARLLNEAQEQENREAMLAYFFLWREAAGRGMSAGQLDVRIEQFLQECLGRPVDFEVDDALAKLLRLGLARQAFENHYLPAPMANALETLDRTWDNYFTYNAAA
jgi:hypothetical protein